MTPAPPLLSLDAWVEAPGLDAATLEALRARWGHGADGGEAGVRHLRLTPGALPPRPEEGPRPVSVSDQTVEVVARGDELWLGEHLHLRVTASGAQVTAGPGPVPEAAWVLALVEAHRAGGWLPLHAAVLSRGDRAAAVAGVSGAGKSTAALRLSGLGYGLLAEDHAWVHPHSGRVVGLDTHLRAREDSVGTFAPHLLDRAVGRDAHGKLRLPLLGPGGRGTLAALLVFGLPETPDAAGRVRALWEVTGVPLTEAGRRAAARGVGTLLQGVEVRGVTRETVVDAVREVLDAEARVGL